MSAVLQALMKKSYADYLESSSSIIVKCILGVNSSFWRPACEVKVDRCLFCALLGTSTRRPKCNHHLSMLKRLYRREIFKFLVSITAISEQKIKCRVMEWRLTTTHLSQIMDKLSGFEDRMENFFGRNILSQHRNKR